MRKIAIIKNELTAAALAVFLVLAASTTMIMTTMVYGQETSIEELIEERASASPAPPPLTTTTTTTTTNTTTNAAAPSLATNNNTTTTMDPTIPAAATAPPPTVGTNQIITNLTWYENLAFDINNLAAPPQYGERVEPLSAANMQYQQQDPAFLKLAQTTFDCIAHQNEITKKIEANPQFKENPGSGVAYTPEDIQRQDLCTDIIRQGVAQFCEGDFATLDLVKCEEAKMMTDVYVGSTEVLYG